MIPIGILASNQMQTLTCTVRGAKLGLCSGTAKDEIDGAVKQHTIAKIKGTFFCELIFARLLNVYVNLYVINNNINLIH